MSENINIVFLDILSFPYISIFLIISEFEFDKHKTKNKKENKIFLNIKIIFYILFYLF
tara:strand:- start:2146 stop:2319 length:174 start_codon:yes stop_codon:yes gene_type:complete